MYDGAMRPPAALVVTILALSAAAAAAEQEGGTKGGTDMAFAIASSDFQAGKAIPQDYTCSGKDVSPALSWDNPPSGTLAFALICDDPDAPGGTWVHWVIYNIPASAKGLPRSVKTAKELPDGSLQGKNDFGKIGYGGPCPPKGRPHRYFFTVYALSRKLPLAAGAAKKDVLVAMQGSILGKAELVGTYGR